MFTFGFICRCQEGKIISEHVQLQNQLKRSNVQLCTESSSPDKSKSEHDWKSSKRVPKSNIMAHAFAECSQIENRSKNRSKPQTLCSRSVKLPVFSSKSNENCCNQVNTRSTGKILNQWYITRVTTILNHRFNSVLILEKKI